jgi:hypothetical protein
LLLNLSFQRRYAMKPRSAGEFNRLAEVFKKHSMKLSIQQILSAPLLITVGLCGLFELLVLLVAFSKFGSLLGSVAFSVLVVGPVSVWVGPPLFKYLSRTWD